MTLDQLIKSKELVILGLNSGTSADSLDIAAIEFKRAAHGLKIKYLNGSCQSYPKELRNAILTIADCRSTTIDSLIYLDQALGKFYGQKSKSFIRKLEKTGITVHAIASHGQTIRHLPEFTSFASQKVRGSLQLGSPEQIATYCGKIVIADFRQADIALGNEGAPITASAMETIFSDKKESRLIINIGGMANYFWFPASDNSNLKRAADCGPGNSLSDILCEKFYGQKYDKNGSHALAGSVSMRLLSLLLAESKSKRTTISTGRERYGFEMSKWIIDFGRRKKISPDDLIATVAEFSVQLICDTVKPFIKQLPVTEKLYLTGGGIHNKFFFARLSELTSGRKVVSIRKLGFDPDLVEASAFAVMGESALKGIVYKTRYDSKRTQKVKPIPGRIIQPPSMDSKDR